MIKLHLLEIEDLNKIVKWNEGKSSDYLLQWAGPMFTWPLTIDQMKTYYLNEVKKEIPDIFVYKIVIGITKEIIGTIEIRINDKENKIGRICRFLIGDESTRGRGIGTQVLKEAIRIGFEEYHFEKITLGVFDFNYGAIKCYENVGFIKDKLLENVRKSSTGYWNLWEMFISKSRWEEINA